MSPSLSRNVTNALIYFDSDGEPTVAGLAEQEQVIDRIAERWGQARRLRLAKLAFAVLLNAVGIAIIVTGISDRSAAWLAGATILLVALLIGSWQIRKLRQLRDLRDQELQAFRLRQDEYRRIAMMDSNARRRYIAGDLAGRLVFGLGKAALGQGFDTLL